MADNSADLDALWSIADIEALAEQRMSQAARVLVREGAGAGRAMMNNRSAWARWALRSTVLRDVSACDLSITLLGDHLSSPVLIAPSGLHGLVHPDAEAATARAARASETLMVLSMMSSLPVERVASQGAKLWFQLYWGRDRGFVKAIVARAAEAGCKALCLTVDAPVRPWLLGPLRQVSTTIGHIQPAHGSPHSVHVNPDADWFHDATLTWKDLDWLRNESPLPIVLKGIMGAEDAVRAADYGANGIIVSNHGGRVLEEGLATAEALPAIADALQGRIDLLVDGGIRSGSDVIKALALGARAVLIGRPTLWGLGAGGEDGVRRVLALIRGEMESVMGMMGLASVSQIDRESVVSRVN